MRGLGFNLNPSLTSSVFDRFSPSSSLLIEMVDSDTDTDGESVHNGDRRHRQTAATDRAAIFYGVRATIVNGRPKRGIFRELAKRLKFKPLTIARQWHSMARKLADLLSNHPEEDHERIITESHHILFATCHSLRRFGKYKHDRDELREAIKDVAFKDRRTYRHLASTMDMPLTTVYRLDKGRKATANKDAAILKKTRCSLKPTLSNIQKEWRFQFVGAEINPDTVGLRVPKFKGQFDKVHIDEKWFWLCKDGEKYLLVDDEEAPTRRVRHKKYMDKVMFLTALARPRWDHHANRYFDGKIGIWPIGHYAAAQRSSVNRPAGTRVWKGCGMGHEKFREMLFDDIIPAIQEKWPIGEWSDPNFHIKIQQDGAGGHCPATDIDCLEGMKLLEDNGNFTPGKISFHTQPSNSPDLNILDLGFFNALQSAYYGSSPTSEIEIIQCVTQAFNEYPPNKINRLWVTLQSIYNCILETGGDNNFKIPHMNKDLLEREGTLPRYLKVSKDAMEVVFGEQVDYEADSEDDYSQFNGS
jgi:hypothetical protein